MDRKGCVVFFSLLILLQSSFVFTVLAENGEGVEGYAEIVSVESLSTVELNGNLTVVGSFQYAFPDLSAVSVRLSEIQPVSIEPEEPVLDYEEFLIEGEGVQSFNLSAVAPSSEKEWNLVVTLWFLGITEWSLVSEYNFTVTVTSLMPLVEITSFTLSNYEPVDGDLVTVSAEIGNMGTVGVEGVVIFLMNGVSSYEEAIIVRPDESYVSSFDWTATEGNHTISVCFSGTTQSIQLTVFPPLSPPPPLPPTVGLQPFLILLGVAALFGGIAFVAFLSKRKKKPEPSLKAKVDVLEKDLADLKKEKKTSFFTKFKTKVRLYGSMKEDVAFDISHTKKEQRKPEEKQAKNDLKYWEIEFEEGLEGELERQDLSDIEDEVITILGPELTKAKTESLKAKKKRKTKKEKTSKK